jgi:hypothetical protein
MSIPKPPEVPIQKEGFDYYSYLFELNKWLGTVYNAIENRLRWRPITKRVAANYTSNVEDNVISVTDTSVPRTITINSDSITYIDYEIEVSDESGGAGANNITVATEGAETINGAATYVISTNYGSVLLRSNGTNLFIR